MKVSKLLEITFSKKNGGMFRYHTWYPELADIVEYRKRAKTLSAGVKSLVCFSYVIFIDHEIVVRCSEDFIDGELFSYSYKGCEIDEQAIKWYGSNVFKPF